MAVAIAGSRTLYLQHLEGDNVVKCATELVIVNLAERQCHSDKKYVYSGSRIGLPLKSKGFHPCCGSSGSWEVGKASDSEFRSMLMKTMRDMAMNSEEHDPKISKYIFRDLRIVAVQCRVSAREMSELWCSRMLSQIGMTPDDYQQLLAEENSLSVELENMSALMQVDQCNIGIKSNHNLLGQAVCTSFLGWGVGSLGPDWTIEINPIFPNCRIRWTKCEANGFFL